jgi:hypothetical protein
MSANSGMVGEGARDAVGPHDEDGDRDRGRDDRSHHADARGTPHARVVPGRPRPRDEAHRRVVEPREAELPSDGE